MRRDRVIVMAGDLSLEPDKPEEPVDPADFELGGIRDEVTSSFDDKRRARHLNGCWCRLKLGKGNPMHGGRGERPVCLRPGRMRPDQRRPAMHGALPIDPGQPDFDRPALWRETRRLEIDEISPKVGDAGSGGVLKLAQAVAELNPLDDLGQPVPAIELAPFALRGDHQLERHGEAGLAA